MTPETQRILELSRQAAKEAIERHRRLGQSIVVWRDGQIVTVEAEDIPPLVQPELVQPEAERNSNE